MRNFKQSNLSLLPLLVSALCMLYGVQSFAQKTPTLKSKELAVLTGTFTGEWAMYGVDERGQVIRRMAWTDTIKAENLMVQEERAYVSTTDEMIFEGGKVPPMKVQGTEGYFLNKDGSLGDYFIESMGQTYRVRKIEEKVWTYTMNASPQELARLGFIEVISARHVIVKIVTQEDGKETHRISRLTTVNWKDKEGKTRWLQYISLQGFHQRQ
ncbi:MAG: hypothetical protein HYR56_05995 [Acidobacteria bacterium]|nr:hypothetical protein [Acidobacteriota bacterium]MBI3424688.1 hypothetical protein [Acidobacteriota bacterium]